MLRFFLASFVMRPGGCERFPPWNSPLSLRVRPCAIRDVGSPLHLYRSCQALGLHTRDSLALRGDLALAACRLTLGREGGYAFLSATSADMTGLDAQEKNRRNRYLSAVTKTQLGGLAVIRFGASWQVHTVCASLAAFWAAPDNVQMCTSTNTIRYPESRYQHHLRSTSDGKD